MSSPIPKSSRRPKPSTLPGPTSNNRKVVKRAMTGKGPQPIFNGNLQVVKEERFCEPGILYTQVTDPVHADVPNPPKKMVDFRPTAHFRILEAHNAYLQFLTDSGLAAALRRYVVMFAHGNLYEDSPRHAFLITKPADSSLHPGCLNLPGGRIELLANGQLEHPKDAAVREFYEETGWQCQFPQLVGLLLPSMYDFVKESPYIVYCYRGIILTSDKQTAVDDAHQANVEKHAAAWYKINEIGKDGTKPAVPNLAAMLPHFASETRCWIVQDCWRASDYGTHQQIRPVTQEIITYYPPEFLEDKMGVGGKKRRINDA